MISVENLVKLQLADGIGRKTLTKLIEYLKNNDLNTSDFRDLIDIINEKFTLKKINYDIDDIKQKTEKILYLCSKHDIEIISVFNEKYPTKLKCIDDKPVVLYVQGNKQILDEYKNIAVIGSRKPSRKGFEIGNFLSEKLAKEGYNIISGLALGCDTSGHRGCLNGNGNTAAMIPSGHEYVYPKANKGLYYQILYNNGAIVSEKPPLSKPLKYDFIDRDRLQAAFSDGILVIESELKSGTVYTVNFGIKYGKLIGCSGHENIEKPKNNRLNQKLIKEKKAYQINNFTDLIEFAEESIRSNIIKCQN